MHHPLKLRGSNHLATDAGFSSQSLWNSVKSHGLLTKTLLSAFVVALALLSCTSALATTYYSGAATGDPTQLTSWWDTTGGTGNHPANFTSGDTFIIQNGQNYTIPAGSTWIVNATTGGTAATIQINSTGRLTFSLGTSGASANLKLGGNMVQTAASSTTGLVGSGTTVTGTIEFTSDGTWTGSGDISNIKGSIVVDAGVTLDASGMSAGFKLKSSNTIGITVNGTLKIGTLTINGNNNSGASFTLGANGTLICAHTGGIGAITGSTATGTFYNFTATTKVILPTTANYTFNGSSAQVTTVNLPSTVNNLTINNAAGVTLSQDTTVNGALALTAGKVTGNVILGSSATLSGGSSTAYLNGQLSVPFSAPSSVTFTFPIGTASAYSPITLANFTDSGTGTLTASATASQNPNQSSSGIDGSLYIARYWTLTDNGGFSSPSYDFTGTYVAGDIQNGADPNNLIVRKWNGGWAAPASSSSSPYTVTGTGFTSSFGQFAAGQAQTTLPVLDSTTKTAITNTSATLGATLENDFSLPVSDYGIVWGTSPSPTTANNKVQAGTSLSAPNSFTANATGLPAGTTVYYRAYAINSSGTGYSTNDSFLTLTNEPTIQASGVSFATRQNGDLFVSWTRGNGAKCIVLVKSGSAVDSDPVDGQTYAASATYGSGSQIGSGNYVTYLGTGTNVTLTGLSAATTYYVAVYELNGSGGSENYLNPPATGSQTTVASPISSLTWTGGADNDWNNTNNWDALQLPDVGTPVTIPSGTTYSPIYSNQMAAASFGALNNNGILNINTNGFNSGAVTASASQLFVNNGGAESVSGGISLASSAAVNIAAGGSLTASGTLSLSSGGTASTAIGYVTNNGGTISVGGVSINANNATVTTSSRFVIAGGTNSLGVVNIQRSPGGNSAPPALGTDGLIISNGVVNMKGISLGNNAHGIIYMLDGQVTNNGTFMLTNSTATRPARFVQVGGVFVNTNTVLMAGPADTVYAALGGTNIVAGFVLNGTTILLTNENKMYIGSAGISGTSASITAMLDTTGSFGATTDWTNAVPITLNGGLFDCEDASGTPHNIYSSGILTGGGALTKIGNGTLTLNAANTCSGNTFVGAGTLALGASGSLNNSGQIIVGSGAGFDVSQVSGYTLPAAKILGGMGVVTGNVTFASTAILNPGSNTVTGTLTFSNSITETGGAINHFDLSTNPNGPNNDLVVVQGDLNISGANNTCEIVGGGSPGSVHPLFKYYGNLNGNLSSFTISGATGTLTNDTTSNPKVIALIVASSIRSPTNTTWVGNATNNVWDVLGATNWNNNGTPDIFVTGDAVTFGNGGLANPNVNVSMSVQPSSVTVDASGDYVFSGSGSIGGLGGILKTNTGRLTIQNTNQFTGGMTIKQGTVSVSSLADDNSPSPLGQTGTLLLDGGVLEYTGSGSGWTRSFTVGSSGGTLSLPSSVNLTYSGTIGGAGALTKSDLGSLNLANANSYSGGTYLNGGTLVLNNVLSAGSGTITFIGNSTLSIGAVKPANTIAVNYNATVTGGNSGGLTGIKNITGTSNLTVVVSGGSVFDLTGDMSTYGGTITLSNATAGAAAVRLNGSSGSKLATWDLGIGTMEFNTRASTAACYLGALQGGANSSLVGHNASDTLTPMTYYVGDNGLSTTFDGTIKDGARSGQTLSFVKTGTGTLALSGANTYTGTTTVSNGTLLITGNSSAASGSVTVYGGTLGGTGTIGGPATLSVNTVLAPGTAGIGTLTFNSSLSLDGASTNSFVVTTSGGVSNAVVVNGGLYPNNSVIQITSGTALATGTYTLFTYSGGIGGPFNSTPVFDVAPAGTASIVDTGSQINLVIQNSSGPSISGLDVSTLQSGTVGISVTNGTPNGSFAVLVSTNLTLPLAQWSSIATNQLDGNGAFSGTVSVDSTAPQQFLMLQVLP